MRVARPATPERAALLEAIREVNRRRLETDEGGASKSTSAFGAWQTALEERFTPSHHLAVYGTLAPGEVNHGQVADLRGEWQQGFVHGELVPEGWGTTYGFPAFRWDPEGPQVRVQVFASPDLPAHWPRLDAFEGPGYRRILVPVEDADGNLVTVANLYAGVPGTD